MIIKSIELENFRNYESLNINFDEHTTILFGDNAQGKTNILESAYMSGTTKSHKGSKDKDVIRFGCEEAHLRAFLNKEDTEQTIDMHLRSNKAKGIALNLEKVKKAADILGIINMIINAIKNLFAGLTA